MWEITLVGWRSDPPGRIRVATDHLVRDPCGMRRRVATGSAPDARGMRRCTS